MLRLAYFVAALTAGSLMISVPAAACDWAPIVYESHEVVGVLPDCLRVEPDHHPGQGYDLEGAVISVRVWNSCEDEENVTLRPADCMDCEVGEIEGALEFETNMVYDDHVGESVRIDLEWATVDASGVATLDVALPEVHPSEQTDGCGDSWGPEEDGSGSGSGCSVGSPGSGALGGWLALLLVAIRRRSRVG